MIEPFRPGTEGAIIDLILGIQRDEFGVAVTAADQPDLGEIATFYCTGAGGFWTARADGKIVGTIALKAYGERGGALRKMFVAAPWRGREHGVGAGLLATLLAHARAHGLAEITLGTIERFVGAHRFYEKNGFVEIGAEALAGGIPAHVDRHQILSAGPDGGGTLGRANARPVDPCLAACRLRHSGGGERAMP